MATNNTGGSVAERAAREGGFRLVGGGSETAGGHGGAGGYRAPSRSSGGGSGLTAAQRAAQEKQKELEAKGYTSVEAAAIIRGIPVSAEIIEQRTGQARMEIATYSGRVGDKFYTNLTQAELESGRLSSNTVAQVDPLGSTRLQAESKSASGQTLTQKEQFFLATGRYASNIDQLNLAIGDSAKRPQQTQERVRNVQDYSSAAEIYQSDNKEIKGKYEAPKGVHTTEKRTVVSSWAERLVRKEKEVSEYDRKIREGWGFTGLDRQKSDGWFVSTGKALGNVGYALTVGAITWSTGANIILTAEKAAFNFVAAGAAITNKEVRRDFLLETKSQALGAAQAITPIDVQTLASEGKIKYDPQGTATLIVASALAGVKTASQMKAARADPNYVTPGKKIIDTSTKMMADKKGAVRGTGGTRKSPLSKPQLRRQSQGLPIQKTGQARFNQGQFVQKAPKKSGVQESIRYDPRAKEATLVRKGANVKYEAKFDSQGNIEQSYSIGKGQAITPGKPFARPPSQIKSPKVDPQTPYVIRVSPSAGKMSLAQKQALQVQQMMQQFQKIQKMPRVAERTGAQTKLTPQKLAKPLKEPNVKETSQAPTQTKFTDGRASVRERLIARAKEKQFQRNLEIRKQKEAQQRQFSSEVDLSNVKMFQDPKVAKPPKATPKSLEVLETKGGTPAPSQYSTESMLKGKGYVVSDVSPPKTSTPPAAKIDVKKAAPSPIKAEENIQAIPQKTSIEFAGAQKRPSSGSSLAPFILLTQREERLFAPANTNITERTERGDFKPSLDLSPLQNQTLDQSQPFPPLFRPTVIQDTTPSQRSRGRSPPVPKTPRPPSIPPKQPQIPNTPQLPRPTKKPPSPGQKRAPPKPVIVRLPPFFSSSKERTPGYNVFTRRAGQVVRINPAPLTYEEAKNYGEFIVGTTARASYRVEEAGAPATGSFTGRGISKTFKEGKDGWTIEKRKYRISSPGELQQITMKGIFASKQKRAVKSIFSRTK